MSIFTSRTAITAGAVAVAVVLSIGGVAVAQASIGQFDDTTPTNSPTGVPSPNPTMSDDGPLHDLGDDHGGDRPDGVSDDGPLHDLNDDHGGRSDNDSDDDGDNSGHGGDDDSDNSGHGNAEDSDDDSDDNSGSGSDNSGRGGDDN